MAQEKHEIGKPVKTGVSQRWISGEGFVDEDIYTIKVDGQSHAVYVRQLNAGVWSFRYDNIYEQTCYGHPLLSGQNAKNSKIPSAAVISIIRGPNTGNVVWEGHWDGSQKSAFNYAL